MVTPPARTSAINRLTDRHYRYCRPPFRSTDHGGDYDKQADNDKRNNKPIITSVMTSRYRVASMDYPAYIELEPPSSARTMFKVWSRAGDPWRGARTCRMSSTWVMGTLKYHPAPISPYGPRSIQQYEPHASAVLLSWYTTLRSLSSPSLPDPLRAPCWWMAHLPLLPPHSRSPTPFPLLPAPGGGPGEWHAHFPAISLSSTIPMCLRCSLLHLHSPSSPPQVVALVDGMPTSIYDGLTVYPLGQTVFHLAEEDHRGGLYCFSTVRAAERSTTWSSNKFAWHRLPACMHIGPVTPSYHHDTIWAALRGRPHHANPMRR